MTNTDFVAAAEQAEPVTPEAIMQIRVYGLEDAA
jgi:hypothetical protein